VEWHKVRARGLKPRQSEHSRVRGTPGNEDFAPGHPCLSENRGIHSGTIHERLGQTAFAQVRRRSWAIRNAAAQHATDEVVWRAPQGRRSRCSDVIVAEDEEARVRHHDGDGEPASAESGM